MKSENQGRFGAREKKGDKGDFMQTTEEREWKKVMKRKRREG